MAHYKLNNIAPSIYFYEKALLLSPNDEEIKNNMAFAKNMTIDAIDVIPETGVSKIIKSTTNLMPFDAWAKTSVAFVLCFVILFLVYYFAYSTIKKRLAFISSITSLFLLCVSLAFAFHKFNIDKKNKPAIVFAQESTEDPEITPEAEVTEVSMDIDEMCPALVTNALDLTQRNCSATSTNEACYGYIFIDAALRTTDTDFSEPGDILDVINIQSLQLSPLDTNSGQWGVIVMSVEANLNDTTQIANDDVQIVLFGDTELRDASQFIEVTATSNVRIRSNPSTSGNLVSVLEAGESIVACCRGSGADEQSGHPHNR